MARTHHAGAAVSTSDLELVKGIGPKVAAVLHDAGINGLAELVASTPEELAKKLAEHQVRVPAEKIVTDDWLGQARTLLHRQRPRRDGGRLLGRTGDRDRSTVAGTGGVLRVRRTRRSRSDADAPHRLQLE